LEDGLLSDTAGDMWIAGSCVPKRVKKSTRGRGKFRLGYKTAVRKELTGKRGGVTLLANCPEGKKKLKTGISN